VKSPARVYFSVFNFSTHWQFSSESVKSKMSRLTILDKSVLPHDCALRSSIWRKIDLKFDQPRETILLAPEMGSCLCRGNANRSQQTHFIPCHPDDPMFSSSASTAFLPLSHYKICQWYIIFSVSRRIYRNTILRYAVRIHLKESETRMKSWKVKIDEGVERAEIK